MPNEPFEKRIQDEMASIKNALLTMDPSDPVAVAKAQGRHEGLRIALAYVAESRKIDPDGDA